MTAGLVALQALASKTPSLHNQKSLPNEHGQAFLYISNSVFKF